MSSTETRIAALSCWQHSLEMEPLGGGITNVNFKVRHGDELFVVRVGDDIAEHNISRAFELAAARAAHAAGIAPEIVHHAPGMLVMRWVEGRTLTQADVCDDSTLARLVQLVQRCHREVPRHFYGPAPMFWVFQVLRNYAATIKRGNSQWHAALPRLAGIAERLERAVGPIDVVFGHNDLLAANFIDDGQRIWLLDWEYAGFNSPLFDLGGLASNNELTPAQESWLLQAYFEAPPDADLDYRYAAMKCASLLRETMWSMVSELHSHLDFDYDAYTRENLARFERAWAQCEAAGA